MALLAAVERTSADMCARSVGNVVVSLGTLQVLIKCTWRAAMLAAAERTAADMSALGVGNVVQGLGALRVPVAGRLRATLLTAYSKPLPTWTRAAWEMSLVVWASS